MKEIKSFADVAIPVPLRQTFTYSVPDELKSIIELGSEVLVPFGRRRITGFVVGFASETKLASVKPIIDIIEPVPLFNKNELEFFKRVAYLNFASLGETIKCAVPSGFIVREKATIRLEEPSLFPDEPIYQKVLAHLQRKGTISIGTLKKILQGKRIYYYIGRLKSIGAISVEHELSPRKSPFIKRIVHSKLKDPDEIRRIAAKISAAAVKKKGVLYLFAEDPNRDYEYSLLQKAFGTKTLKSLEKDGIIEVIDEEVLRFPKSGFKERERTEHILTDEQKLAVESILSTLGTFRVHLLYGVTGSGKTEVYIRVIKEVLSRGCGVIYLVPEISIIPQIWARLRAAFEGEKIAVYHSYLGEGERLDIFRGLRDGIFRFVIGARSAVFAPVKNLGLIIVDEEHSSSYKQHEPAPYYNARDVAILRGEMENCPVILGSATPSIESFYNALQGKYNMLELPARVPGSYLPEITVVDLHDERIKKRAFTLFSEKLRTEMETALSKKEKVLLLLNRRGYSNLIQCGECGYVPKCPECGISYTYHRVGEKLVCHWCGKEEKAPERCPSCEGLTFRYRGRGTQRVEAELKELFGDARMFRLDRDTSVADEGVDTILSEFARNEKAILIGTQMISKGLDFPDVTVVGVLNADIGLSLPDFRSSEKTFALLAQVAGRAGRGEKKGKVVIQTFSPS
ncbi:MAG: replication restart helicase PriA, partial [bacterium]